MKHFLLVPVLLFLVVSCFGGCAGQSEGELCNRLAGNNGNDDCQNGLVCDTSVTSTSGYGRCCPGDRARATTNVCKGSTGGIAQSPAPPASTSTGQSPEASSPQAADGNPPEATTADADSGVTE